MDETLLKVRKLAIINKLLDKYPIIKLCNNIEFLSLEDIENYNINFELNDILHEQQIIIYIKYLLEKQSCTLNTIKKTIIAIIIYKILFDNIDFVKKTTTFKDVFYKKILEFTKDYNAFEKIKKMTGNRNALEIIIEKHNIYFEESIIILDNLYNVPLSVSNIFIDLYNINDICNSNLVLFLHSSIQSKNESTIMLNFRVINNYDKETFNKVIYTLLNISNKSNLDKEIIVLTLFEIFINNIFLLMKDEDLKVRVIHYLKYLIENNLSDYNNYNKYNYDKNPIITINNLINFYLF